MPKPESGTYLAVTIHGHHWFPHRGLRGKICWKTSPGGWSSLRWPFRMVFKIRGFVSYRTQWFWQPLRCRVGWHHRWDITNLDGSVTEGYCGWCDATTKPVKAYPPRPEVVEELERDNKLGEEYDKAMDAYDAGTGPCWACDRWEGHDDDCFLNEDVPVPPHGGSSRFRRWLQKVRLP